MLWERKAGKGRPSLHTFSRASSSSWAHGESARPPPAARCGGRSRWPAPPAPCCRPPARPAPPPASDQHKTQTYQLVKSASATMVGQLGPAAHRRYRMHPPQACLTYNVATWPATPPRLLKTQLAYLGVHAQPLKQALHLRAVCRAGGTTAASRKQSGTVIAELYSQKMHRS